MATKTGRSGHSTNCEQARRPPCECGCGGAEHGWQGALAIAAASSNDELRKLRREAEEAWTEATRRRPGQRKPGAQTTAGQHAATRSFIVDVIGWLRRDRNLREATKQLGEPFRISRDTDSNDPRRQLTDEETERFVKTHVIPTLRKEFGDQRITTFQEQAREVHFWCELLAQTAHALDEFKGLHDRAKRAVVAVLTIAGEKRPDGWISFLSEQKIIERAVELVLKLLPKLATSGIGIRDAFGLIWPARVLAVLMCREPRRHPAVREYCLHPIVEYGKAEIRERVKDQLRQAFPDDMLRRTPPAGETPNGAGSTPAG